MTSRKDKERKYPQLRFPGFTAPWELHKLGEISKMYQPKTITGKNLLSDGIPVFGANGFIGFYSEANHKDDQVTISARGEGTGTPSYVCGPVWITGNSMVVNVDDFGINKHFLFANLTANSLKKYVTGGAQPQLTRDVLVKVPINLPSIDEQQKIGTFFKQLDHLITLYQRKLEHLQLQKKGLLQKMFPKKGEVVPELRFPGFTDAWEQHKLGEVVDVRSGHDYKHLNKGDIPVYGTGGYMLSVDKALSENESAIGIGRKGTIDKPFLLKAPFWTVDTLFYAVPKIDHNLNFINSIFEKIKWKKYDESTGVPSLSKSTINSVITSVPKYDEQQKIGNFFQQLDQLITLHQRKLKHLQLQKKGLLQKMFPQKGETVPEIRFPGFTAPWEQHKLGEVTQSYSGGTPLASHSEYYSGSIPFIRSAEINSNTTELFLTHIGLKESSAKMVEVGDILYALYGATSGEVGISKINGAINQAILAIKPKDGFDSRFIMQWLRFQKQKIIDKYLQGGQGNLSGSIVKELVIFFPNYEEQDKIGAFFEQLDHLIALHQHKLEHLQLQKKGLLQKMFC